jgi:hypothetical protein
VRQPAATSLAQTLSSQPIRDKIETPSPASMPATDRERLQACSSTRARLVLFQKAKSRRDLLPKGDFALLSRSPARARRPDMARDRQRAAIARDRDRLEASRARLRWCSSTRVSSNFKNFIKQSPGGICCPRATLHSCRAAPRARDVPTWRGTASVRPSLAIATVARQVARGCARECAGESAPGQHAWRWQLPPNQELKHRNALGHEPVPTAQEPRNRALVSAAWAEARKHLKYDNPCMAAGTIFQPFALETTGGHGECGLLPPHQASMRLGCAGGGTEAQAQEGHLVRLALGNACPEEQLIVLRPLWMRFSLPSTIDRSTVLLSGPDE